MDMAGTGSIPFSILDLAPVKVGGSIVRAVRVTLLVIEPAVDGSLAASTHTNAARPVKLLHRMVEAFEPPSTVTAMVRIGRTTVATVDKSQGDSAAAARCSAFQGAQDERNEVPLKPMR